ncbi:MAG TPA: serine hydrolase domain-containing protein [Steroidobacteraceae bacterium]|nr:serine hydrolase domain-containing protein [Steroidobacteraceae bacterium]
MSSSGLSRARLARMHGILAAGVDSGEVPGVATLIGRGRELHVDTIGLKAVGGRDAIRRDTIFRIASMTKPITAVGAMILVEECKLRLDEPLDRLLPELAKRSVLKRIEGPLDETVPANRSLTLRDLLTFRMGFGMLMGPPNEYPIQRAVSESQLQSLKPAPPHTPDEWLRRLGALPLMYQPGERWMYHTGSDVLGVLIARASGKPFEAFLRERVFEPLGMQDTGFSVPAAKLERLASCYQVNPKTRVLELYDDANDSSWAVPPAFPAGGGGLVSTLDDYHAFGRMLLSGGRHGSEQILSRASVETMTTDQLSSQQKAAAIFIPGWFDSRGWGFGVSVVTRRESLATSPGQFGWGGAFGTSWISDPREDLVAILMTQCMDFPPRPTGIRADFLTCVYQALED